MQLAFCFFLGSICVKAHSQIQKVKSNESHFFMEFDTDEETENMERNVTDEEKGPGYARQGCIIDLKENSEGIVRGAEVLKFLDRNKSAMFSLSCDHVQILSVFNNSRKINSTCRLFS